MLGDQTVRRVMQNPAMARAVVSHLRQHRVAEGFDPTKVKVPGDGPVPCKVMLVGERPGKDEPWANPPRPFVGMAGKELDRYLLMAGLRRDEVYVTNLVKFMAYGDEDPTPEEIKEAEDDLLCEMLTVNPDVVVPLGAIATRYFLGDVTMEQVQGIPHEAQSFGLFTSATIFPIIHPAAGLHNPDSMPNIVDGFERLHQLLGGRLKRQIDKHPEPRYQRWSGNQSLTNSFIVAIDTEGSRKRPWCLSFSIHEGEAYVVKPEAAKQFGQSLDRQSRENENYKVLLHNSLHDLSVLASLGIHLKDDNFIDTMVLAYLLCLEPQGLKALAYRHAGMSMSAYEDIVAEADQMLAVEYLYQVAAQDWGPAEPYVIVETVAGKLVPKVKKPQSLNQRVNRILADWVKTNGATDCRKRWSKMADDNPQLVEAAEVMYDGMPEATLDEVEPQVAEDYAARDADATLRIYPVLWQKVVGAGMVEVSKIDHDFIPMVDRMQQVGMPVTPAHFTDYLEPRMLKEMEEIQRAIQAETGAWINPDSGDQVAELLFGQLKLPWTKLTKKGKRPKCDDKVLEGLIGLGNPIVKRITDYRERSKIRSSFCNPIASRVDSDGRIRCNLRITRVSSGRLAANTPNLLAIPVRTELGLEVRKGFIAPDGRLLGTRDLDQIEMREMAHQSEDEFMCEVLNDPRRDIHSETAALMFGIPIGNVDKQRHRYPAKRVGFGVITGITGLGLLDQMRLAGATDWTEDRCNEVIKEWFRIYPGVRVYMEACRTEARRYGFVRDRWGRRRYLPAIHSPIRHVREEAERQSHSFKISASAQGIMKLGCKKAWDRVFKPLQGPMPKVAGVPTGAPYVEPLLQIHDELVFEVQEDIAKEINENIGKCLTTATSLRVPILSKGDLGRSWADVK